MSSNQSQSSHGQGNTGGQAQDQGNVTSAFSSDTESTRAASNASGRPPSPFGVALSDLGAYSPPASTAAPAFSGNSANRAPGYSNPPTFNSKPTSKRNSAGSQGSVGSSTLYTATGHASYQPNRYSGTGPIPPKLDAQGNVREPEPPKTYTPTGPSRSTTGGGSASGR